MGFQTELIHLLLEVDPHLHVMDNKASESFGIVLTGKLGIGRGACRKTYKSEGRQLKPTVLQTGSGRFFQPLPLSQPQRVRDCLLRLVSQDQTWLTASSNRLDWKSNQTMPHFRNVALRVVSFLAEVGPGSPSMLPIRS